MPTNITGYYEQVHFHLNELKLYYNIPPDTEEIASYSKCPHIDKLRCSRAKELAPDKCITERKCELYEFRDRLFFDVGVDGTELKNLDELIRNK